MSETCRLCGSSDGERVLERSAVPVLQNSPMATPEAARAVRRGDLRLWYCRRCTFFANVSFEPTLLRYGTSYDSDQTWSPRFSAHVDELVSGLIRKGISDCDVVEVGCGNGYFLTRLCMRGRNRGQGFDPSYVGPASVDAGRVTFRPEAYRGSADGPEADVVISRHVLEHVVEPVPFLASLRAGLRATQIARVYVETPSLEWIVRNGVFQDFFYEHCSYFSEDSLALAMKLAGFQVDFIGRVFESQYLWAEGSVAPGNGRTSTALCGEAAAAKQMALLVTRYSQVEKTTTARWARKLALLAQEGPVAVWGAGAKGVTFVNLLDPSQQLVSALIDLNPRKQGRFAPGTGHPIRGPETLPEIGARNVVLMNPAYRDEIRTQLTELGLSVGLHAEGD